MKTILCFGDSNTYGHIPPNGGRYPYEVRWPGAMQLLLGRDSYYVIEEGLNSRTTVHEDALYDDNKSGLALLPALIKSHMPLDLCILMLGSNDMKQRFSMQAADIARACALLIRTARQVSAEKSADGTPVPVLLVAPPPITPALLSGGCAGEFGERALHISAELSPWLEQTARSAGAAFLDAAALVTPSEIDGLHLSAEGHQLLARAMADKVKELLG